LALDVAGFGRLWPLWMDYREPVEKDERPFAEA
jgi:hypothetical protein